jgi:carboxypeptidase C (cathepsin A)
MQSAMTERTLAFSVALTGCGRFRFGALLILLSLLCIQLLIGPAAAQEAATESAQPAAQGEKNEDGKDSAGERLLVTRHTIGIGGVGIEYEATTGYLELKDDSGKHKADIFFTAYVKDTDWADTGRPITFAFNGGPGAASVWLHLGALGPKSVRVEEDGKLLPAPHGLIDNPNTWLPFTDLVFIDPVGTGLSRAASGEDPKQFWSVQGDVESVGEFIRLYCTKYNRWLSPKFIAGESYGATRAAALSSYLQDKFSLLLNGVVLISPVLNFQTISFDPGNDLPYVVYLPAYTATAWYYGKLAPELQKDFASTLAAAEQFAVSEYNAALAKGAGLAPAERSEIVEKLSYFTGLSTDFIDKVDLRIDQMAFSKELLRDARRAVARLDSRFQGIDADVVGRAPEYDPSLFTTAGAYGTAMRAYLRTELQFESDLDYEVLNSEVTGAWNWQSAVRGQGYVYVADNLRNAMTKNSYLKVFVGNGYYDLGTPYFATWYTVTHLGLDPGLAGNVTVSFYPAGHQMYMHRPSHEKMSTEVAEFYRDAPAGDGG